HDHRHDPPPRPSPTHLKPLFTRLLENLLTGRSVQEIRADPRFDADIATQFNEEAGVVECGIVAVTDTFTRALAAGDLSTLPEAYYLYVNALRELAVVARHVVAHGHHMYCFWSY
ncbi:hypothetical protein, partial [Micromonospora sp. DT47]|uniref:hypothetical protein n=1 Tax=Micromonospora sp. DT47 TaxID=3393431 RepID=UPI003CF1A61E